jgi:hypothetical protein
VFACVTVVSPGLRYGDNVSRVTETLAGWAYIAPMSATVVQISTYVRREYGFVPTTRWISEVKRLHGLPTRHAQRSPFEFPCPADKRTAIEEAIRHFGMIQPCSGKSSAA